MRLLTYLVIFSILWGGGWLFEIDAYAAHDAGATGAQEVVQAQKDSTAVPVEQAHKFVLPPFYQLQRKDSKIWMERIIVTFLMAMPKDGLKDDLNNVNFRKMVYELLQSGAPAPTIQSQAVAGLIRQLGRAVEATVQISRSVIIVR
jgi:hypothetical protein